MSLSQAKLPAIQGRPQLKPNGVVFTARKTRHVAPKAGFIDARFDFSSLSTSSPACVLQVPGPFGGDIIGLSKACLLNFAMAWFERLTA